MFVSALPTAAKIGNTADLFLGVDGLGNQQNNKLPVCQLEHIQDLVNRLQGVHHPPALWWCDTLCVPRGDIHRDQRREAIKKMRDIYKQAEKVLVIDGELMRLSGAANIVEIYLRMKMSGWMRRLWTLQEGLVAQDVHIQFSDGTRRLGDVAQAIWQDGFDGDRRLYSRYSGLSKTFFAPFVEGLGQSLEQIFKGLLKQLQWRATSRRCDEAICFSNILGVDTGLVMDIAEEDLVGRMIQFLKLVKLIPLILLLQPPPRLQVPGFRWASPSLINCFRRKATEPFHAVDGVGRIEDDKPGLIIVSSGLVLESANADPLRVGSDFVISVMMMGERGFFQVRYTHEEDKTTSESGGRELIAQPGMILLTLRGARNFRAFLVDIDGTKHTDLTVPEIPLKVNYVAPLTVQPMMPVQGQDLSPLRGLETSTRQTWLVC